MFLPDYVKKVTDIINGAGEKAFPVGGCVRDSIMGKTHETDRYNRPSHCKRLH